MIVDDSVRLLELKSHNIDFTEQVAGKDLPAVKADASLGYVDAPWFGGVFRLVFNARGGPFAENLKLRQAVLFALDREAMARTLGQAAGVVDRYFLGPGELGYDNQLPLLCV